MVHCSKFTAIELTCTIRNILIDSDVLVNEIKTLSYQRVILRHICLSKSLSQSNKYNENKILKNRSALLTKQWCTILDIHQDLEPQLNVCEKSGFPFLLAVPVFNSLKAVIYKTMH